MMFREKSNQGLSLWYIGYDTHFSVKMSLLVVNVFKKMNQDVMLLQASGSKKSIFLLLGQKCYLLCKVVESYLTT